MPWPLALSVSLCRPRHCISGFVSPHKSSLPTPLPRSLLCQGFKLAPALHRVHLTSQRTNSNHLGLVLFKKLTCCNNFGSGPLSLTSACKTATSVNIASDYRLCTWRKNYFHKVSIAEWKSGRESEAVDSDVLRPKELHLATAKKKKVK